MIRAFLELVRLIFVLIVWAAWAYISLNIAIESKRTDGKPLIVTNIYQSAAKDGV